MNSVTKCTRNYDREYLHNMLRSIDDYCCGITDNYYYLFTTYGRLNDTDRFNGLLIETYNKGCSINSISIIPRNDDSGYVVSARGPGFAYDYFVRYSGTQCKQKNPLTMLRNYLYTWFDMIHESTYKQVRRETWTNSFFANALAIVRAAERV